jgi:membrane-bound lytic murein transglycosylase B
MRAMKVILAGVAMVSVLAATPVMAAQCGNTSAGFDAWVGAFKQEAAGRGVSASVLDRAFSGVSYNQATIRADRGQHSFKLSFEQFMQKRGGQTIISRGKTMKKNNASLFASIERAYGVPAGPLLAIWGMETGFGGFPPLRRSPSIAVVRIISPSSFMRPSSSSAAVR